MRDVTMRPNQQLNPRHCLLFTQALTCKVNALVVRAARPWQMFQTAHAFFAKKDSMLRCPFLSGSRSFAFLAGAGFVLLGGRSACS